LLVGRLAASFCLSPDFRKHFILDRRFRRRQIVLWLAAQTGLFEAPQTGDSYISFSSVITKDMAEQFAAPIRVLLIASYGIVLFGLEKLIESKNHKMKVVGKFTQCSDVFPELENLSPDVIVVDLDQEPMDGVAAVRVLVRACRAKIIILSGLDDPTACNRAMLAGAKGLVGKKEALEVIPKAIEKVYEGQLWLDRANMGKLIRDLANNETAEDDDPDRTKISALTARERSIVAIVTSHAGVPCKVIAEMLHISERTLRNHLGSIYEKLGVANRLGLLAYAHAHELNRIPV
jgi:DNA-binding NarL/FixJ family response regulator